MRKGNFIGRDELREIRAQGLTQRLSCMTLGDPDAVATGKEPIMDGNRVLGYVTSANYGHSIGRGIVYGYLPMSHAEVGNERRRLVLRRAPPGHRREGASLRPARRQDEGVKAKQGTQRTWQYRSLSAKSRRQPKSTT